MLWTGILLRVLEQICLPWGTERTHNLKEQIEYQMMWDHQANGSERIPESFSVQKGAFIKE